MSIDKTRYPALGRALVMLAIVSLGYGLILDGEIRAAFKFAWILYVPKERS